MPIATKPVRATDMVDWLGQVDDVGDLEWLVSGMIPRGGVCLLSGQQKRAMKTFFSIDVAISLAMGVKLGGVMPCKKGKTVIVMEEGSGFGYRDRFDAILNGHEFGRGDIRNQIGIVFRKMVKLDQPHWRSGILEMAKEEQPDLIIFDSLYRMFSGDENKQEDANKMLDTLLELGEQNFASLVIVHLDKTRGSNQKADIDDQVRGSGVITNGYDSHIALRRYDAKSKLIDLIVRPREGDEMEKSVAWSIESNHGKIVSARMKIKEKVGRAESTTDRSGARKTRS